MNLDRKREQKRLAQARYRETPRGKASRRKWLASAAGRRYRKSSLKKYRSTTQGKAARARYMRGWAPLNKDKVHRYKRNWMLTPKGLRHREQRNLGLPAFAPDSLIHGIKLLRALKQETRKWTSTN